MSGRSPARRRYLSIQAERGVLTPCAWFALCVNDAVTTRPHPVLGDVPICRTCDEKINTIGGTS